MIKRGAYILNVNIGKLNISHVLSRVVAEILSQFARITSHLIIKEEAGSTIKEGVTHIHVFILTEATHIHCNYYK